MNQPSAPASFLHITYRPDNRLLVGRWLRSVSDPEMQDGYDALRQAAMEHGCRHWLIDSRRRTDRSLNGPEWVVSRFLPALQRELSGSLYVSFLVLPDHLHAVAQQPESQPPAGESSFQFARFIDEGEANAWLAQRRDDP
ncbi:hypothetical protein LJY25_19345 [Hymenobacter sp. BT175]|uniref:hypothetical protein n=1 Tax=Hymenobacter translucens TaxID=2886507 RepID=UPI001D0E748B|nr:hypothetical protein [Hymenobacter translucens]MCC2548612.1 hypothetical protein [Hymenobacter translucens]